MPTLLAQAGAARLVVSDGGSTDRTLNLALSSQAVLACGASGRGAQMARGAERAAADDNITAYLFLHADCVLPAGWMKAAETALMTSNTAWYFRYRPHQAGSGVAWLRFLVWLRGWAWNLPYGDQGLLMSRDMYDAIGGYDRDKPLFEDVDIVDRIKLKFGRHALKKLPLELRTDVSDHLRDGVWARGWRNFSLLRAYRNGAPLEDLVRKYT